MATKTSDRNEDPMQEERERTMYVANLHDTVTEELLFELFVQAGPVQNVKVVSGTGKPSFGFITFKHDCSVPYAMKLMSGVSLFGRMLQLKPRAGTNTERKIREEERRLATEKRDEMLQRSRPPQPNQFYSQPPPQQFPWQGPPIPMWNGGMPNAMAYGASPQGVYWGPPAGFNPSLGYPFTPSPPPPHPREIPLERTDSGGRRRDDPDEEIMEVNHGRSDRDYRRSGRDHSSGSSIRRQSSAPHERSRDSYEGRRSYQPSYDRNSRY